jgi:thiol:disulfide interchange protein
MDESGDGRSPMGGARIRPNAFRACFSGVFLVAVLLPMTLTACNSSETPETTGQVPAFRVHRIYDRGANIRGEIRTALAEAVREHKRVLLDFGGNWCGDCQVLDYYFHLPGNAQLLAKYFVLVDVDIGEYNLNLDIAREYDVPLQKGVPALAVLDANGRLLYSQQHGEFEAMSKMDPAPVTRFLERWK